jgi:uncharacterized membrane protein (DUF2068 family)
MQAAAEPRHNKSDFAVVAIGIFKLVKCVLLLTFGIALIRWRNDDLGEVASNWITRLWLSRSYFEGLVAKLSLLSRHTIYRFAVGSFIYSALLSIEGIGLCLRKRWAEYLTVAITASLLPFEFYELSRRFTASGVVITILNIAILLYLIFRLFKDRPHP